MRRVALLLLAIVFGIAALAGAVNVRASNASVGADIFGVGGGKTDFGFTTFSISAHSGSNGDFGQVVVKESLPVEEREYTVDVDCVNVDPVAMSAVVSGLVTRITPVPNFKGIVVGHRFFFLLQDRGQPSPPRSRRFVHPKG
jgi:hypothetical protein